jgi:hypothetical protein
MAPRTRLLLTPAAALAACALALAAPRPSANGPLVVIDASGKEQKLKSWAFTAGVRRLSWLVPEPAGDGDGKAPRRPRTAAVGPEALEFREENSTPFVEGVLTFIPLDRLRTLEYDGEAKTVTARVAAGPKAEDDAVLTGTTRYERVNKLVIEAEVDKGDLGVADVRFVGGAGRGVRSIRFPAPSAAAPPGGRPAVITTRGKDPSAHKVSDVQALYRLPSGHERLLPLLMFKKTLKLDVAKLQRITAGDDDEEVSWQVLLKDGGDEALTLLRVIPLDGKEAQLEGLLGRVPGGYKLFPVLTVGEVVFDSTDDKSEGKPDAKPDAKPDTKPKG